MATAADGTVPVLEDFANFAPVFEELLQQMTQAEHNKDELRIACCRRVNQTEGHAGAADPQPVVHRGLWHHETR